jgi:uncharacterized protein (TIGR00299 family) protein
VSRLLYFDCFSGISGDMVLGALIDAGLPFEELKRALGTLAVEGYHVHAARVLRAGVSATKFTVHDHDHAQDHHRHDDDPSPQHARGPVDAGDPVDPVDPVDNDPSVDHHGHRRLHRHHRSLPEIFSLIDTSALSASGRDRAKALFQRLAEAEAAIHQMPVDEVHLHEVGAVDSIVDIVGAVFALDWFGADQIVASPLNVGGGMVQSAHGLFPVPAPATVSLLGGAPIYGGTVQKELVTPTGALIISSYAASFGPIPAMTVERVGYGAGDHDFASTPNVLRVLVGRPTAIVRPAAERVVVVECEIDDMNPQLFGIAMDRLYAAGALEVFYVSAQMKKNRPGTLLTVVAPPELREAVSEIIFRETTTIGLRYSEVDRECLQRELVTVETPVGRVQIKLAWRDGRLVNAVPEFEDCASLAAARHLSVKEVQALAVKAFDGGQYAGRARGRQS